MKVMTTRLEQKINRARKESEKPNLMKEQEGQQPVQRLYQRVAPGDGRMAGAAFCPQEEKADDRDIVIPADLVAALRAGRGGEDNRFLLRQPADADVEKRADDRAEDERRICRRKRQCIESL